MSALILHFVLVCFITLLCIRKTHGQCRKVDSCTCIMEDGSGEINLHSLDAGNGGIKFNDLFAVDGWYYSYNPCSPFNKGDCAGVAACQTNIDITQSYAIATAGTEEFKSDGTNIYIGYTGPGDGSGLSRVTTVTLVCDQGAEDPITMANGESSFLLYSFTLYTKCACPDMCKGSAPPPSDKDVEEGISGGSVLCIVFFALLAFYVAAGITYNRVKREKTGKELIPNIDFWSALPGLIKDGFIFLVFQKIRPSKTYDSI